MPFFLKRLTTCTALLLLGVLVVPLDGHTQSTADTLRSLLPQELGGMTRSEVIHLSHSVAFTTYRPPNQAEGKGRSFRLTLGYGKEQQRALRQNSLKPMRTNDETALTSTITIAGHPVHVLKGDSLKATAIAFPGSMAVMGILTVEEESAWEDTPVQERMTTWLRPLDLERLAAVTLRPPVAPVNHKKLRAPMPARLDSLERTSLSSWSGGAPSLAEAIYKNESRTANITILITDIVALPEAEVKKDYGWTTREIDRETNGGYDKTTRYRGHKAHVSYVPSMQSGHVSVLVADRFVVKVSGQNLPMSALKEALGRIDLAKLKALNAEGDTDD